MAQQIIDVGAAPNDGQGDPLRTAFEYTNNNFTQLFALAQSNPPTTLVGEDGDVPGMYAYDPIYFYYCFAAWDGSSDIWAQVTQIGNISTNQIVSGNSNVVVTGSGGAITVGIGGTANIVVFAATGTSITGNVTSSGYFLGNGALLTGLPQTYANANVQAYAESGWSGNIVPSANAAYNLGSATNQWKSLYVSNTTIYLGNVPIGITAGNVLTVNGNAVLTDGSNANISTTGNVTVGAILTDGYYFANGSPFTTPTSYGNANVVANLAALASNPISTSGTITAGNINITGGSLTWANASITQTSASDVSITGDGQVTIRSLDGTYQWTFDSNGNLTAPGNISTTANVTANNINMSGTLTVNQISSDDSSFVTIEDGLDVNGDVTANYFIGDGSQLTNLPGGNATLPLANGTSNFNIATANGNATVTSAGNTWTFGGPQPDALYWPDGSFQATAFVGQALDLVNTGNASITSNSTGNTTYVWTFDDTGNLTIPNNIISNTTIDIDNRASGNSADIQLFAADDITLQARDRSAGSTSEGGDINIFAGDSAEDGDSSGGDIQILAGDGGAANVDFGGPGGFITIQSGQGGAAIGNSGYSAESGGALTLNAGDAGSNNGNIDLGADGGNVYIGAGDSTGNGVNGGTIYLTSGAADASALAGDVVIQAGGTWTFDGDGNLSAPGNVSAVGNITADYFIGDGSQLTGITANANTGNVTFSNQIVLGTGTNDGSGGLYLAPGTDSIANSAVQYLRVRGGDVVTHIHLDTGNNAFYDQYFGNDNKFVKLEAGAAGNVVVGTDDPNGNSYNWTFGSNGRLTFPGTPRIDTDSDNFEVQAAESINFEANAVINIYTDSSGNTYQWQFGDDGNLTLPGNTIAINYLNGNLAFGTVTFNNEAVIGTGTSNTQSGLYLAPDPGSLANNLYLRVRGNILDEPTHIHFDTGNNQYYNQFIGDDLKYIQLANTGNIVINTNNYVGNSAQWNFGSDGRLINLEGLTLTAGGQFNICTILTGGSGYDTGSALKATTGGSGSGMTVAIGYGLSNQLTNADVVDPGTGYVDGDVITVSGGTGGTFVITRYNDQANQGNNNFIESNWVFGTDGLLTFPTGNLVIIPDDPAGNIASITSTDHPLGIFSTGANGAVSSLWIEDYANVGTSNIAAVYANPTPGSKIVRIAVGQNGSPGPNLWDFNTNGTLTLPNSAVIKDTAGNSVAFGLNAGQTSQGIEAVAIGDSAGSNSQGQYAVAIGTQSGSNTQGAFSVAAGYSAAFTNQANSAVAIGSFAGATSQGLNSVAVGVNAGYTNQGIQSVAVGIQAGANVQGQNSVAIGAQAGYETQGGQSVAIGIDAGYNTQGNNSVAIGTQAGNSSQGNDSVAIGTTAGFANQGIYAVAMGYQAGNTSQGNSAVAIGENAGYNTQGISAVAVGDGAGRDAQGQFAVALGYGAGNSNQANNSIILNATGSVLEQTTANTFTVAPIRNDVANIGEVVFYNTSSKEITYGNTISVAGNITGNYILGNGSQLTGLPAPTVTPDITSTGDMSIMTYDGVIKSVNYATVEPSSGNIKGGNITTTGLISATGNITGGNISVAGGVRFADTTYQNTAWTGVANNYIALGTGAGGATQSQTAVAIGVNAGNVSQDYYTVAIGIAAGRDTQLAGAIAIGGEAGGNSQGTNSIAIGYRAGRVNQANNSIVLNSTGANLNNTTANTFTVAPIRNDVANVGEVMFYNTTSKEITYGNAISVTGNVTGNYFIGNGSQLTSIAVPSQTILPTIQTITVEARPAGLFGGGQGGANVTVANVIPVTEYGVIITDGTVSEKYKTGSLGSIPGTVSLTFTTGLNSAQFTVFAYVTSNAGTFYSNSATGTSGICLLAGTQIALSDGTHKAIEHITYTDNMLSWDFDRGCYAETTAMWIKRGETGSQYNLLTFSDGTTLRTFDQHRIFNKQAGAFTYPMTAATPVGTITVNEHGQEITLMDKQVIVDTIEYYNVITDYHMNLFSDTVLTSCRFNNIYPITDMKFVKDGRTLRSRAEFENVEDRFFHGLRLAEQTTDIETVEWYVNRLLSTEVLTQPELTF